MGVFVDDFVSLGKWNINSGSNPVTISPAGWAYHAGNAFGTGQAYRAMAAGDVYIETKLYFDVAKDWAMIKLNGTVTNLYNQVGAAVLISHTGSLHNYLQNGGTDQIAPSVRAPYSAVAAIRVGLHCRPSALAYDFYLEGLHVGTRTVSALPTGTWLEFGAYNGAGVHFDYIAVSDRLLTPYDARNIPSGVSY